MRSFFRKERRRTGGAAMIESIMAMMLILLILFGLLQIFQLSLARLVTEYAAFRGARSAAVGFADYLANREARVQTIAASGDMVSPEHSTAIGAPVTQYYYERIAIERYMEGTQMLSYDYWGDTSNNDPIHDNYHCPYYGKHFSEAGSNGSCPCTTGKTSLEQSNTYTINGMKTSIGFQNYPLRIPMHDAFLLGDSVDINGNAAMYYYAGSYLE